MLFDKLMYSLPTHTEFGLEFFAVVNPNERLVQRCPRLKVPILSKQL
jgi:hypothetical protein